MKYKFLDKGANLQSKGLIINQDYEVSEKRMHKSGVEIVSVIVPGLEPIVIKVTTLEQEFKIVLPDAVCPPPIANTTPVNQVPGWNLKEEVKPIQQANPTNSVEKKDILLAGLQTLNFDTLNLKLNKTNGKLSMVVILDSMPPLGINSDDMSAQELVDQILNAFSENALIISSIKEWNKSLKEMQAEKEIATKKVKDERVALEKESAKNLKAKTAVQKTTVAETVRTEPVTIVTADVITEPEEEDLTDDLTEEENTPAGNLSGLSGNAETWQLM